MENKVKIRLRLVIIKEDKLLAYYDSIDDYYFYIGGKLEFGETIEDGWKREIKEEQRYIKAYGAEMIDSEQLKESTEDLKKQKKSIEQQILSMQKDTVVEHFDYPEDKEIEEFCKIAHKVVGNMGFEAKQSIVRKVVDTIVGTQNDIKVYGHLPLNTSIIANVWKGGIQDVKFETSSRNSWLTKCGEVHAF